MDTPFEWKNHLVACMQSTEYCCLGTSGTDGVWTNPIYFAWDDSLNLYFISLPHSRHMQNIKNNPRIAVSIYNTAQSTHGDVVGIQLDGIATILTIKEDIEKAYTTYYGRVHPETGKSENMRPENFIDSASWQFVKIIPEHVYYFDTQYFNEEKEGRQEVPPHVYGRKK